VALARRIVVPHVAVDEVQHRAEPSKAYRRVAYRRGGSVFLFVLPEAREHPCRHALARSC
jgi:hypothetical protein